MEGAIAEADDLIGSKLASGRPRDLADVDELRKAAESQAGSGPGDGKDNLSADERG
jgi:hypothetical protein